MLTEDQPGQPATIEEITKPLEGEKIVVEGAARPNLGGAQSGSGPIPIQDLQAADGAGVAEVAVAKAEPVPDSTAQSASTDGPDLAAVTASSTSGPDLSNFTTESSTDRPLTVTQGVVSGDIGKPKMPDYPKLQPSRDHIPERPADSDDFDTIMARRTKAAIDEAITNQTDQIKQMLGEFLADTLEPLRQELAALSGRVDELTIKAGDAHAAVTSLGVDVEGTAAVSADANQKNRTVINDAALAGVIDRVIKLEAITAQFR